MECNKCSWSFEFRILLLNEVFWFDQKCLHHRAEQGLKPFPACEGLLWQKEITDNQLLKGVKK